MLIGRINWAIPIYMIEMLIQNEDSKRYSVSKEFHKFHPSF